MTIQEAAKSLINIPKWQKLKARSYKLWFLAFAKADPRGRVVFGKELQAEYDNPTSWANAIADLGATGMIRHLPDESQGEPVYEIVDFGTMAMLAEQKAPAAVPQERLAPASMQPSSPLGNLNGDKTRLAGGVGTTEGEWSHTIKGEQIFGPNGEQRARTFNGSPVVNHGTGVTKGTKVFTGRPVPRPPGIAANSAMVRRAPVRM
jgi:hypothetical protein